MDYFLSIDGGGTKTNVILFNSNMELVAFGCGEGVNPVAERPGLVQESFKNAIIDCMKQRPGTRIKTAYISMPASRDTFQECIESLLGAIDVVDIWEAMMSTYAGLLSTRGGVALAGTGSGVFWVDGSFYSSIGGWGYLLGDQGSGYYIGREGLLAAVKGYEGTGPKTSIQDILMEKHGLQNLRELTGIIYNAPSLKRVVASATLCVAEAARSGDEIAVKIYEAAGKDIGEQAIALLRRTQIHGDLTFIVAGSVWKGYEGMYQSFVHHFQSVFPNIHIMLPVFEPVMGGVVCHEMNRITGALDTEKEAVIRSNFRDFLYRTEW